jgi:hypothetical protein
MESSRDQDRGIYRGNAIAAPAFPLLTPFCPHRREAIMTSGSTKNPEQEAQHPAPMPEDQQGQGSAPKPHDPEGRQGGQHGDRPKAKMAVHSDSPPGIELDGKAHAIPLDQRTRADRQKALGQEKPR